MYISLRHKRFDHQRRVSSYHRVTLARCSVMRTQTLSSPVAVRTLLWSVQDTGSAAAPSRTPPPTTTCRSTAQHPSHARGIRAVSHQITQQMSAACAGRHPMHRPAGHATCKHGSAPREPDEVVGEERPRHHQRVAGRGQQHRAQRHPLQAGRHRKVAQLRAPTNPSNKIDFLRSHSSTRRRAGSAGSLTSGLNTVTRSIRTARSPQRQAIGLELHTLLGRLSGKSSPQPGALRRSPAAPGAGT